MWNYKINNNEKDIKDFLDAINQKLFHTMQLRYGKTYKINHTSLPEKHSTEWNDLDRKIQEKAIPVNEDDYALCKLCRLDQFLQGQIARLEIKGIFEKFSSPDTIRIDKLQFFQKIREDLISCFDILNQSSPNGFTSQEKRDFKDFKDRTFNKIIKEIDRNYELLSKQRGFFHTQTTTTLKEYMDFKKKFNANTQEPQEPSPEPNSPNLHSKKP